MRTRPSGFTLVEVMLVVTIIGLLSSVAIPSFRSFQLRSRQAERTIVVETIRKAVEDYFARDGRFPQDWGAGTSGLSLWGNPSWTVSSQRRPFRRTNLGDDWTRLDVVIDGGLYYNYWGSGQVFGRTRQYWIVAEGDLDANGVTNTVQRYYWYEGAELQRLANVNANWKCTWQWEWPAGGLDF